MHFNYRIECKINGIPINYYFLPSLGTKVLSQADICTSSPPLNGINTLIHVCFSRLIKYLKIFQMPRLEVQC